MNIEEIREYCISLKCDPELALKLREQHPEVTPAWHFNKIIYQLFYTVTRDPRLFWSEVGYTG